MQDFIKEAYPDSPPVKPSDELASSVGAQLKNAPTRNTHRSLEGTSLASRAKKQDDDIPEKALSALYSMLKKATDMDNEASSKKVCSIFSGTGVKWLQGLPANAAEETPQQSSLQQVASPQHHYDITASLQQAFPLPLENQCPGNPATNPEPNNGAPGKEQQSAFPPPKSLEEYEKEHFEAIQKHKRQGPVLKRPSAAKVMKKPSAHKQEVHEQLPNATDVTSSLDKGKQTCWGCTRCRGNCHGCDSCNHDGFQGIRLNGRAAWKKYMQKNKKL